MDPLRISLAPSGELRLHLPTGRPLDFQPSEAGLRLIQQVLRNAASGLRDQPGHIAEFPTQHVLNAWMREDRLAKQQAARDEYAAKGIDLDSLEISL